MATVTTTAPDTRPFARLRRVSSATTRAFVRPSSPASWASRHEPPTVTPKPPALSDAAARGRWTGTRKGVDR